MNGILIFRGWLYCGLFMAFFAGCFFSFETQLTRFKARFGFRCTLFLKTDFVDLRFFLAEILHQRNAAWAHPGAGAAFYAVRKIMSGRFIMLLAFAKPVQLLW